MIIHYSVALQLDFDLVLLCSCHRTRHDQEENRRHGARRTATEPLASVMLPERHAPVSMSEAEASSGEGSFSYWTPPNGDRDGHGPHPMLVGDHGLIDEDSATDIILPDEPFQLPSTHDASSATVDAVYFETNPEEYETAHMFAARDTSLLLVTPLPQR